MQVQYKLDPLGKVESFSILQETDTPEAGFIIADSEQEFERVTGFDLSNTTCEYSTNKTNLKDTDTELSRPLEDVILALLKADIELPASLIERAIDKQTKRNRYLGKAGVIITKKGSCYHTNKDCPSLIDSEIGYITEAQAISDKLSKCLKCTPSRG